MATLIIAATKVIGLPVGAPSSKRHNIVQKRQFLQSLVRPAKQQITFCALHERLCDNPNGDKIWNWNFIWH